MYVTRIESSVIPGKLREYEAFLARASALNEQAPGFRRGGVGNSLGFPSRYTSINVWQDRASAEAFRRSDALQDLLAKNQILTLMTPVRPAEAYEIVHRVQDRPITEAGAMRLLDITIDPTRIQEFEQTPEELLKLRQKFGHGLISNSLCRSLSGGGRYMAYFVHTDVEAGMATNNAPEMQAFYRAQPLSNFGGAITAEDRAAIVRVAEAALVR